MTLVDEVERLGAAVESGELVREDAVQRLLECSDGGLTRLSAASLIDSWSTARARYQKILADANADLRRLKEGQ